jgi:hypothetical protein
VLRDGSRWQALVAYLYEQAIDSKTMPVSQGTEGIDGLGTVHRSTVFQQIS